MAESGIDLSYDESRPAKMSITTGSGGIRVIGTKSPSTNSISASMTQPRSLRQVRLRSSQRLQLMKMQAEEAEAKHASSAAQSIPVTGSASSLPATTSHTFLGAFQPQTGSLLFSSQSSGSMIPNLHDYAAPSFYTTNSAMDEEELLSDISGVLEDDMSSCGSFNIPSLANSCIAESTTEKQEAPSAEDEDKTSSSCPLIPLRPATMVQPYRGGRKKEPPPIFPNEESKLMWLKEREKKDQHNNIEKKRRSKINDYIHELATLLPENYDIDLQNKKGNILEASVDYIRKLQTDEKRLHQMRQQQEELEKANRRLQLQVQLLQMNVGSPVPQQAHPHPHPTTNPPEVSMSGPLQSEFISPLHQHLHLATDTQLLTTDTNFHTSDQNLLMADPNLFAAGAHGLDFMAGDLFNAELGLDNLDPIFAGLHVVTPKSASDHQIPLVVEELMDLQ